MKDVQNTAQNQKRKAPKKLDEQCQDILALLETGEISIFKSKNQKASVSIGLDSSRMRQIVLSLTLELAGTS